MAHQYRTEVIGSLLRPEYLNGARKRWDGGEITAHKFKETEDRGRRRNDRSAGEFRVPAAGVSARKGRRVKSKIIGST
jgi:hypothetical protein